MRDCGPCSLCCKVLDVPGVTVAGAWCAWAKKKKGCAIHHVRPEACRAFDCLWRQGAGPEEMRPDKIHAVLAATPDGQGLVVHEDPGWRGAGRTWLRPTIAAALEAGHRVFVVCGDLRRLYTTRDIEDPAVLRPDGLAGPDGRPL